MSVSDQRAAAWSGMVFTCMFFVGLILVGWLPLPSPAMSADQVVAMYRDHTDLKRLGFVILMLGVGFFLPFTAVTSHVMRHMQCSRFPAYMQMIAGTANSLTILLPQVIFGAAAFRPDRDPQVLYALHDIGWFIFAPPISPACMQNLAIACGIFMDRSPAPAFPRWFAYLNVWAALLYLPGVCAFFFKTGPFAWNGILGFYIPAAAFFTWIIALTALLLRAIGREQLVNAETAA